MNHPLSASISNRCAVWLCWLLLFLGAVISPTQTRASFTRPALQTPGLIARDFAPQVASELRFKLEISTGILCGNDPVNRHDPLGLASLEETLGFAQCQGYLTTEQLTDLTLTQGEFTRILMGYAARTGNFMFMGGRYMSTPDGYAEFLRQSGPISFNREMGRLRGQYPGRADGEIFQLQANIANNQAAKRLLIDQYWQWNKVRNVTAATGSLTLLLADVAMIPLAARAPMMLKMGATGTRTLSFANPTRSVINGPAQPFRLELGPSGLGDALTSPWLADARIGVVSHLEQFRGGGSYLAPESVVNKYITGQSLIGRTDGQFITTSEAMNSLLKQANGDLAFVKQKLGIPAQYWNEPLFRIDVQNPLLFNARMPSGMESGANSLFWWGGYTRGGIPEAVLDPIPVGGFTITPTGIGP